MSHRNKPLAIKAVDGRLRQAFNVSDCLTTADESLRRSLFLEEVFLNVEQLDVHLPLSVREQNSLSR